MADRGFITGLKGTAITAEERAFLREASPVGLIVFRRNIADPLQLKELIEQFRAIRGPGAAILIDQEGGRVQRMGPPHWAAYPAGAVYGELYRREPARGLRAAWLGARLMAADLAAVGITVDCLPLADVPVAGADQVIGDRAYGDTAPHVALIAAAAAARLGALSGPTGEPVRPSLAAGCDLILHCNGEFAEMREVAANCPELGGAALQHTARALASRRPPETIDIEAARAEFMELVSGRAGAKTA